MEVVEFAPYFNIGAIDVGHDLLLVRDYMNRGHGASFHRNARIGTDKIKN
jgi:hypothetical protein